MMKKSDCEPQRYVIRNDGSGHDYFIRIQDENDFEKWVESVGEDDGFDGNRIDGCFTFTDPRCDLVSNAQPEPKKPTRILKPGPQFEYKVFQSYGDVDFIQGLEDQHNLYGWELVTTSRVDEPGVLADFISVLRRRK